MGPASAPCGTRTPALLIRSLRWGLQLPVRRHPVDHGEGDRRGEDRGGFDGEEILAEDGDVGQHPRAQLPLGAPAPRRRPSRRYRRREPATASPRSCGATFRRFALLFLRVTAVWRPVRTSAVTTGQSLPNAEGRTRLEQRAPGEGELSRAARRCRPRRVTWVGGRRGVERLHGGGDPVLPEERQVLGMAGLDVLHAVTPTVPAAAASCAAM